ncbi:hypothetical protein [Thalassotalea aquiviva]|uniref:hypothetical protein n=1 Tax=Thalassotalea aquiviva TaxID=3242415 RepID=UPI00352A0D5F
MKYNLCSFIFVCGVYTISLSSHAFSQVQTNNDPELTPMPVQPTITDNEPGEQSKTKQLQRVEDLKYAIEKIESEEGAYGDRLSQELLSLGQVYFDIGEYPSAIESFKRSLHLNRINDGLYAQSQIPIIKKLIDSYKANKQWEEVGQRYAFLYRLHRQNFPPSDPQRMDLELEMANWQLESFYNNDSEQALQNLLNANAFYKHSLTSHKEKYGPTSLKLIDPINGLITTNYLLSRMPGSEAIPRRPEYFSLDQAVGFKNDPNRAFKSFSHILDLIEEELYIQQSQPDINHLDVVKVLLKRADWCLINHKRDCSIDYYADAQNYVNSQSMWHHVADLALSEPVVLHKIGKLNERVQGLLLGQMSRTEFIETQIGFGEIEYPDISAPGLSLTASQSGPDDTQVYEQDFEQNVEQNIEQNQLMFASRDMSYSDPSEPDSAVEFSNANLTDIQFNGTETYTANAPMLADASEAVAQNDAINSEQSTGYGLETRQPPNQQNHTSDSDDELVVVNAQANASASVSSLPVKEMPISLHLKINVNRHGVVRNIRTVNDYTLGDKSARIKILKFIKQAKFRPKIANGQPVDMEDFELLVMLPKE